MTEPRMRLRQKGQVFSTQDLQDMLYAFGDKPPSLSTTISCLDEILTDFIIETCHAAALCASYSRRQKIKVDDFKFVLRKDPLLLGRVMESMWREKFIKQERKMGVDFESMTKETLGDLVAIGGAGGDAEQSKPKRGRKKKRKAEDDLDGEGSRKRLAS